LWALVDPPADPNTTSRAREILRLVYQHRRLLPGSATVRQQRAMASASNVWSASTSRSPLCDGGPASPFRLAGIPRQVSQPVKSSRASPDMAEELSLRFLNDLCEEIRKIHEPGARVTICSDGMVSPTSWVLPIRTLPPTANASWR